MGDIDAIFGCFKTNKRKKEECPPLDEKKVETVPKKRKKIVKSLKAATVEKRGVGEEHEEAPPLSTVSNESDKGTKKQKPTESFGDHQGESKSTGVEHETSGQGKRSRDSKSHGKVDDSEFFDLRGDHMSSEIAEVLGVGEETAEKRYLAIGNLQPAVGDIYEEVFKGLLRGLEFEKITVDWTSHVTRVHFSTPEDALVAVKMVDRKPVFGRKIKAGLSVHGEGEVLVRNIQSHVTADVLSQYLSRSVSVVPKTSAGKSEGARHQNEDEGSEEEYQYNADEGY